MRKTFMAVGLFFFNILYPSKIINKDKIPEGGAILACNHLWALDPGFVFKSNPKPPEMFFLAKKELFEKKFNRKFIGWLGGVPVDRDKPEIKTMTKVIKLLKDDNKLVIFPEGTRNKTDQDLLEFNSGVIFFALKSKKPIIPMVLDKKAKLFRKTRLMILDPFDLSEYYDRKVTEAEMSMLAEKLRDTMKEGLRKLREKPEKVKKKKAKSVKAE